MQHCAQCGASIPGDGFRREIRTGSSQRVSFGRRATTSRVARWTLRTVCHSCALRIDREKKGKVIAGTLAAAALGLFLLTRGHDAPGPVPDTATRTAAQPTAASPAFQPQQPSVGLPGSQAVSPGLATETVMPPDMLAAAMQRLKMAQAQGQGVSGQPAGQTSPSGPSDARAPDVAAQAQTLPSERSVSPTVQPAVPQRPVAAGRHTTASGMRWSLVTSGDAPSLAVDLGSGKEAVVRVGPEFLKLDLHAMSRNVERVGSLIFQSYMGAPGNYLFTPDGRLFRTE